MRSFVSFTAWGYEPKHHSLTGAFQVHGEPASDGSLIYRVPPYSTLVEPPIETEKAKAVFIETRQQWVLLPDHRGEVWFDEFGRGHDVERLGDPVNWGWSRDPRPERRRTG